MSICLHFFWGEHPTVSVSPLTSTSRCHLISIVRLRRRKVALRRQKPLMDGALRRRGTFVNVWLVLNGLLLDYRVFGGSTKVDVAPASKRRPLPGRLGCGRRKRAKANCDVGNVWRMLRFVIFAHKFSCERKNTVQEVKWPKIAQKQCMLVMFMKCMNSIFNLLVQ